MHGSENYITNQLRWRCSFLCITSNYTISCFIYIGTLQQEGDMSPPPTLKSRGTFYVWFPPTFTTTFILIGWSPYIHTIVPVTLVIYLSLEKSLILVHTVSSRCYRVALL